MANVKEAKKEDGYYDKQLGVYLVSVTAGFYKWTKSPDVAFSTTLGSCLSVCACDLHTGIGGMNHFLLPEAPDYEDQKFSNSFRYGSAAIETLLNALYSKGAAKNGMTVKIFGGGKVLNGVTRDIGQKNIDFTKRFFQREHLRIQSEDVGGFYGRRVIFFPVNGRALSRPIGEKGKLASIAEQEGQILQKISKTGVENDVELF